MKKISMVLAVLILLSGCTSTKAANRTVYAMDTVMEISVWGNGGAAAAEAVEKLILELDGRWSATDPNSLTSLLNAGGQVQEEEDIRFLNQIAHLCEQTNGALDPKMHNAVRLWGFLDDCYQVPSQDALQKALAEEAWNLGAVVKGYTGRRAVELLQTMQVDCAILNLGGNVQTYGEKKDGRPWIIGIQNPWGGDPAGNLSVTGTCAVVTSGDYQRYFEKDGVRYHHILDPKTGMPAETGLTSVTVICSDGVVADALSTALFVMGLELATAYWREHGDFEAVFIDRDGKIYATEGARLSGCVYEVIAGEN